MKKTCRFNVGFTLIELMVVFAIIGLIFTVGIGNYQRFNQKRVLEKAAQDLKTNLRLAQDKALAGEKPAGWCNASGEHLKGYRLRFVSWFRYLIEAACSNEQFREVKSFYLPGNGNVASSDEVVSVLFKVLGHGIQEPSVSFTLSGYGRVYRITVSEGGQIIDEGFVTP